jgi:flavin-dependent dehydrogenase
MSKDKKIIVVGHIGHGSSGEVAARLLAENGIDFSVVTLEDAKERGLTITSDPEPMKLTRIKDVEPLVLNSHHRYDKLPESRSERRKKKRKL